MTNLNTLLPDPELDQFWEDVKAGKSKVGCRLGLHHGTAYGNKCDRCTAEIVDMMTFKPDEGPWVVSKDGRTIQSDDFRHDVALYITGDFFNDQVRREYAEHIARVLNTEIVQRTVDLHNGPLANPPEEV